MSISTGTLTFMLQGLNLMFLVSALMVTVVGIILLYVPKTMVGLLSTKRENEALSVVTAFRMFGGSLQLSGMLFAFLQIYGIYHVRQENANQVRRFGVIHLFLLIMSVICCIFQGDYVTLVSELIFNKAVITLSFKLAERFRECENRVATPITYSWSRDKQPKTLSAIKHA